MWWLKVKDCFVNLFFFYLPRPLSDSESNKTADEPCKKATSKTLAEKDILINFSKPNQEKKYVIVNSEHLHGVIAYVSAKNMNFIFFTAYQFQAEYVKKNATLFESKAITCYYFY